MRRLTAEQAARYVDENHRNADSLLAAYRTSGDTALLHEAMAKYPDNPQVAFEAILNKDTPPEERRQWAEAFKKAAPENALANYFAAAELFKAGQTDRAVQELAAAAGKSACLDYTLDRVQADEEAYRSAGYSDIDTSMASTWGLLLPQLMELKKLSGSMVDLSAAYQKAGDNPSAQAALDMALQLGGRFDGTSGTTGLPLVTQLVGIAIQQKALSAMDPESPFGDGTVQQRIDQLAQFRQQVSDLVKQTEPLRPQMTPQDWINYNSRTRMFGEANAIQWLITKYGQN